MNTDKFRRIEPSLHIAESHVRKQALAGHVYGCIIVVRFEPNDICDVYRDSFTQVPHKETLHMFVTRYALHPLTDGGLVIS